MSSLRRDRGEAREIFFILPDTRARSGGGGVGPDFMLYFTERLILRTLTPEDTDSLYSYYERNREFLQRWEPLRDESYYSRESIEKMIRAENIENKKKSALRLYLFPRADHNDKIIGFCGLTNIVYGSFLSCFLGYKLDRNEINKGLMTEAVSRLVKIAFDDYKLHRIESNVIPANNPSKRVMEKMSFSKEGISRKYLKINGKWEDHIHYVLLNSVLV